MDELLQRIRDSWWLSAHPEGLVVLGSRPLGVLTLRTNLETLRLVAVEPLPPIPWGEFDPDPTCWLESVTLRRRRREPDVWDVLDGAELLALVPDVLPVVGPLPAPWAVVAVGDAWHAQAVRWAHLTLRQIYDALLADGGGEGG